MNAILQTYTNAKHHLMTVLASVAQGNFQVQTVYSNHPDKVGTVYLESFRTLGEARAEFKAQCKAAEIGF